MRGRGWRGSRRAQQRFRERQRGRLQEAQERAEAVRAALTQLRIEHDILLSRNTVLERFKAVRQVPSPPSSIVSLPHGSHAELLVMVYAPSALLPPHASFPARLGPMPSCL